MPHDPLSHVASWVTPASAEGIDKPETSPPEDPVLALIAEDKRLAAIWVAATERGDDIFRTLPEDIQKGRVRISFSACAPLLDGGFTSEADLHRLVDKVRQCVTLRVRFDVENGRIGAEVLAAAEAEFDREIGLDQALAQLRNGLDEITAAREASGCEAHYREAGDLEPQLETIRDRLYQTRPITLAGAIAMLELGLEGDDVDDDLINAAIAGLRDMQVDQTSPVFGEPGR